MRGYRFPSGARASLRGDARAAFTLLELLAVLVLLGVLSVLGVAAVRGSSLWNATAATETRRLALELGHARRRAIASGDNHALVFVSQPDGSTTYTLHARSGPSLVPVDEPRTIAAEFTVTVPPAAPEFTFEGSALTGATIQIDGPQRSWQLILQPATGQVQATEL